MSIDLLFADFDRLIQSPESVHRLRRFILDLAVRGKLVPQDPNDEPALELLKRIVLEKARLVKAGKISVRKIRARDREHSAEFAPPSGWVLSNLGEIATKITDGTHKTPTYVREGVPFVSVKDFSTGSLDLTHTRFISKEEHDVLYKRCDPRRGDILLGRIGTLGKAVLVQTDIEFSLFVSVGLIRFDHRYIAPKYFLLLLNSPFVETEFDRIKIGGGTHTYKLNLGDLHTVTLPIPPLADQRRIVAKVSELMAICDRLEAARAEREATRDRLATASLARLNAPGPDPARFQHDVEFTLNNLASLTTRPDQIKALRKTILSLAVRGKMVPQDPNDEPASEMLNRIAAERARLVKAKKIRKQGPFLPPDAGEVPFDLPGSWSWSPSLYPSYMVSDKGKKIQTRDVAETGDFPVVDQGKVLIRGYHNDFNKVIRIKEPIVLFGDHTREVKLIDFDFVVGADGVKLLQPLYLHTPYYFLALQWIPLKNRGYGRHFKLLKASFIPLPPLAEQRRIVAKVDKLMALCDRLEASLSTTDDMRTCLLNALMH